MANPSPAGAESDRCSLRRIRALHRSFARSPAAFRTHTSAAATAACSTTSSGITIEKIRIGLFRHSGERYIEVQGIAIAVVFRCFKEIWSIEVLRATSRGWPKKLLELAAQCATFDQPSGTSSLTNPNRSTPIKGFDRRVDQTARRNENLARLYMCLRKTLGVGFCAVRIFRRKAALVPRPEDTAVAKLVNILERRIVSHFSTAFSRVTTRCKREPMPERICNRHFAGAPRCIPQRPGAKRFCNAWRKAVC